MGNALLLANTFIFPAPPASYTSQLYELIWIPKRFAFDTHSGRAAAPGSFPVLYLPSPAPSNVVMIYLHGNSCDIGQVKPELRLISHELNATIMAVEYPGYGVSPEVAVATGELINFRVRATVNFLISLGVDPRSIVLFGRSIGTGPAAAIAAEFKKRGVQCGGVVLQSPYISIHKIVEDYFTLGTWLVSNFWDTEKALRDMAPTTPLLIIHGLVDEIVPVAHGQTLFESYSSDLKMADFQPASKHNMYSIIEDVCVPIEKFLTTLSLSKDAPVVNLKLPQWCLYSCHKLVSGQTLMERNRKAGMAANQEKQICSARTHERRGRPQLVRNYSMNDGVRPHGKEDDLVPDDGGLVIARKIEAGSVSARSAPATEGAPRQVNRTTSKTSFQSSLQYLQEQNDINSDEISEIVNDAIARTTNM
ncbi:Abhydrolase domain-containing protein [Babesia bigemina]|uniref:Abhydrolase domain-containing protein n=1 Tax=Babesia bigemina TaxID=5866 RepID=A0A061D8Q5_BABBI|nr:Abhydrolase domain-containing protein [Babesia bigemina]CDR96918.1 Abhydrolase domain-containing protein [Babesia bigemina]|eukprot:XP_012769104.1 Abhydrolase domain-containing protein [Babesia bigemina]